MKRILHICAVLLTFIILVQSITLSAFAATAKISISGPAAIEPGTTFEVVVSVNGTKLYGVNGAVTFGGATLKEAAAELQGDWKTEVNTVQNTVYFAAVDQKQNTPINKKTDVLTLTFVAGSNVGEKVSVSVSDALASTIDSQVTLGNASYSKNVAIGSGGADNSDTSNTEEGPSNNNLLDSLIVKNAEITPAFDPEVKDYKTTVPFTTEELEVEATAADPNATVTIGDTKLEYVGNNIVRVEVLSESGLKRTYKIYATREDKIRTSSTPSEEGLPLIWIILICLGAALLLAAAVLFLILFFKKRKKKNN